MLDDVDRTLGRLLAGLGFKEDQVSFNSVDAAVKETGSAMVNLFLYDVRENLILRSNERMKNRAPDGLIYAGRAPVRIDCAYLITAWAGDLLSEHRLLGKVMISLLRYPHIPAEFLQGELAGQDPLPTSSLQASNLQSLGEFWQAMGNKPRAALAYTVTISVDPYAAVEVQPVREHVIAMEQIKSVTGG